MHKRPHSVTAVSLLIAASGTVGLAYHLTELNVRHPFQNEVVWVSLVRLVAIVCGVFMLRGSNWARWLAMVWIGFHLVISIFHSFGQLAFHSLLFVVFAYILFRPPATEYFRAGRVEG
jgi:hypothetical protein